MLAVATLGSTSYAQNAAASPPFIAPQSGLPSLSLARTLTAPNEISTFGMLQSGNAGLTWSADGEQLAAYVHNGLGIIIWSPDGKYQREISRYNNFGLDSYVLGFSSGHRQLITSPAAETNKREDRDKLDDMAFSVLDAETGKVLRSIVGPNPGRPSRENIASFMAISPDERFVAVIYRQFTDRRIGIYSTGDWQRVAALDLHLRDDKLSVEPNGLSFSPDGKTLAVVSFVRSQVMLFEVGSWKWLRSIATFSEASPRGSALVVGALAFSPDGKSIAVASQGGGSWWKYPNGKLAPKQSGALTPEFPAEPLRVYRVSDGAPVASVGSFPAGLSSSELAWSPRGDYLAFLDALGDIHFWDPSRPGASVVAASMGRHASTLLISKDGSQLVANFENGVAEYAAGRDYAFHHALVQIRPLADAERTVARQRRPLLLSTTNFFGLRQPNSSSPLAAYRPQSR
jgi:WD40-like Beta Propeller Repeat